MNQATYELIRECIAKRDLMAQTEGAIDLAVKMKEPVSLVISSTTLDGKKYTNFGIRELDLLKYIIDSAVTSYGTVQVDKLMYDEKLAEADDNVADFFKNEIRRGDRYLGATSKSLLEKTLGVQLTQVDQVFRICCCSSFTFFSEISFKAGKHTYRSFWEPIRSYSMNNDEVFVKLGGAFEIQDHFDAVSLLEPRPGSSGRNY